jgi:hypothetical protein
MARCFNAPFIWASPKNLNRRSRVEPRSRARITSEQLFRAIAFHLETLVVADQARDDVGAFDDARPSVMKRRGRIHQAEHVFSDRARGVAVSAMQNGDLQALLERRAGKAGVKRDRERLLRRPA